MLFYISTNKDFLKQHSWEILVTIRQHIAKGRMILPELSELHTLLQNPHTGEAHEDHCEWKEHLILVFLDTV